jgi:hypothetical protein
VNDGDRAKGIYGTVMYAVGVHYLRSWIEEVCTP